MPRLSRPPKPPPPPSNFHNSRLLSPTTKLYGIEVECENCKWKGKVYIPVHTLVERQGCKRCKCRTLKVIGE